MKIILLGVLLLVSFFSCNGQQNHTYYSLAEALKNPSDVFRLVLNEQNLKEIPESIGNLTQLKELYLDNNEIEHLPLSFGNLKQLEILWLNGNKLQSLPATFGNLTQLEKLILQDNQLKELPKSIGNLTKLVRIHLENNQLSTLPISFGNLSELVRIYLFHNELEKLPPSFNNLTKLTMVELSFNRLKGLPNISNLEQLKGLGLDNNKLQEIPASIFSLVQLEGLSLNNNELSILPEAIGDLRNLTRLDLKENELKQLPESIGNLTQLKRLDLKGNEIKELPNSFVKLEHLRYFDLNELLLGTGVVRVHLSGKTAIFKNDNKIDSIWVDWDSKEIFQSSFSIPMKPYEAHMTPAFLEFRIVGETEDMLLIILNEKLRATAWINKGEQIKQIDWLSFLTSFDTVEIGVKTKLSVLPNDIAKRISQKACGKFEILEMQDNWIKIESTNCEMENVENSEKDEGWVKWNDGKKVLVNRLRSE